VDNCKEGGGSRGQGGSESLTESHLLQKLEEKILGGGVDVFSKKVTLQRGRKAARKGKKGVSLKGGGGRSGGEKNLQETNRSA